MLESLRQKQKSILEQKEDDISDLRLKLSDAKEASDRFRQEKESLRSELDKLHESIRQLKDDSAHKYEQYSRQLNLSENANDEKLRQYARENERLKEENETVKKQQQQSQISFHE